MTTPNTEGWVIIHPSPSNWHELDYFYRTDWDSPKIAQKFPLGSDEQREKWRKTFRPDCEMRRAKIILL